MSSRFSTTAVVTGTIAATLCMSASAFAATTATITGANINSSGTQVSVTNVQVKFDSCPGFDPIAGFGLCGAKAGVVPASSTCPSNGVGIQDFWNVEPSGNPSSSERIFNSGAKSVGVSPQGAYRVCAYSISGNSGGSIIPASETTTLRADALTPAPPPPKKKLTKSQATSAARQALAKKFGAKYSKGKQQKVNCSATSPGRYNCKVSWKLKKGKKTKSYKGTVAVSGSPSNPKTVVNVK